MCFIIRLAESFDGLGSSRKYVLEQPPMGRTANETLAQNYESREMSNGVRGKVVKLCPEVIHDALEERMRGPERNLDRHG